MIAAEYSPYIVAGILGLLSILTWFLRSILAKIDILDNRVRRIDIRLVRVETKVNTVKNRVTDSDDEEENNETNTG
jgi:hypothetical protein